MSGSLIVDARLILDFSALAVKEQERIYGTAFSKMVAKYATEYEAKKIGDQNPPPTDNIDQCIKYLAQNTGKYKDSFSAIPYGIAKAEKMFEGGIASAARLAAKEAMIRLAEKTGTATLYGKVTGTTEAWKKDADFERKMHALVEDAIISGDENSAVGEIQECHYEDACKAMLAENILTIGGQLECAVAKVDSATIEAITHHPHDYKLLKFDPPMCSFRIFKIL
jgi:hypothetical protein